MLTAECESKQNPWEIVKNKIQIRIFTNTKRRGRIDNVNQSEDNKKNLWEIVKNKIQIQICTNTFM